MEPPADAKIDVVLGDPERTDLLGLLIRSLLARALTRDAAVGKAAGMRGAVVMRAGRMVATVTFDEGRIVIRSGEADTPRAWLSGGMEDLLNVVAGKALVAPVLRRRVRFGGNLLLLLRLLFLVRVTD